MIRDLSAPMLEVMERIGKCAVTAHELGVNGAVLKGLAERGLLRADLEGAPAIYHLSPKGEALIELMTAPVAVVPTEGVVARIQRLVAHHYNIPLFEMWSQRRSKKVARPRQIAMYFAREMSPLSLPSIGRRFGKRDHTTVMHGISRVEKLIETDPAFAADIATLREALEG